MVENALFFITGGACLVGLFWAYLSLIGYGGTRYKYITSKQLREYPKGTVVYTVFCGAYFAKNKKFLLAGFRDFGGAGECVVGTHVVTGENVVVKIRNSFVVEVSK